LVKLKESDSLGKSPPELMLKPDDDHLLELERGIGDRLALAGRYERQGRLPNGIAL
jgi:hypothetical protein